MSRLMSRPEARLGLLAVCLLVLACSPGSQQAGPPSEGLLARAQEHIAAREYWASETREGLQAPNRRHALRSFFEPTGVRVHDRTAGGSPKLVELRLAAVGRGEALAEVVAGELSHREGRIEIERPGLVEWYENTAAGLEQGFTLASRPAEGRPGELVLDLTVTGATAGRRGEAVVFASGTGRKLAYDGLVAFDARGESLPAQFELAAADRVRIRIDDTRAVYPVVIDPLLTATEDGFFESDQASAYLGWSVAGAGDVNGDGYADVIVGAYLYDAGQLNEGAAFLFHGSASGLADAAPATAAAQLEADQGSALLGSSVAGAGDLNGDGYADVIVGAYSYDSGQSNEGAAFVFLGSASGVADGTPATAATQLESDQADSRFGFSVAGAGDVDGDGYADVIVGAPLYDAGQTDEGAAFVFLGSGSGIADGTPASAAAQIESNQASANLGTSVAGAGDTNADGYAEVIVGADLYDAGEADEGAAFVFLGTMTGTADGTPSTAVGQLESNQASARLGSSVAGAGDVDGDGYADVIVGAHQYDAGETEEGAAFVFLGSDEAIQDGSPVTASAQLESDQTNAYLGRSVAGAGDVNGDGYADVIVGAHYWESVAGEFQEGAAFVFLGSATGVVDGTPTTAFAQIESDQSSAYLGQTVAGAGDVNGDGYADVIVGAPFYDSGQSSEGAAFVFLGGAAGVADGSPLTATAKLESNQANPSFGSAVSGAGDVNGDGYADVIVGAYYYDSGQSNEGAAFVFHGGPAGIADGNPVNAATQLEADQADAYLGYSVAGAGDVNGDGYADVIVGARAYDSGQTEEGAAFVFLGSASGVSDGTPATAATRIQSDQGYAYLGRSVAGAGDVNGDGYADVIVGAHQYAAGQSTEGAAFVFHGSSAGIPDGTPATAAAQLESDQAGAQLGHSVAGAGDVDGDGYGDVIVGAMNYDNGETDEGAAFVFLGSAYGIADATPATAAARLESDQAGAYLGSSVAGAGDVNGDGYADVIVGAYWYDDPEVDEGAAFVFLGSSTGVADGTPATAAAQIESDQASANLGWRAAGAGDVNGDGYADVIVGAHYFDSGENNEGAAFVVLGSSTGIADTTPATAAAQLESNQLLGYLGASVAGAGDVNGDGYADVIAGAASYDSGLTDEGAAFVFLGNTQGRLVQARQLRGNGSGVVVQPWGRAVFGSAFQVEMRGSHPAGSGQVQAEVEACPVGANFGDSACTLAHSLYWTPLDAGTPDAWMTVTVNALTPDEIYRWRARVLHADPTGPVPANPAHGPWRRVDAQALEGDIRMVPEPGSLAGLAAGIALLAGLGRRRARGHRF